VHICTFTATFSKSCTFPFNKLSNGSLNINKRLDLVRRYPDEVLSMLKFVRTARKVIDTDETGEGMGLVTRHSACGHLPAPATVLRNLELFFLDELVDTSTHRLSVVQTRVRPTRAGADPCSPHPRRCRPVFAPPAQVQTRVQSGCPPSAVWNGA
jgi:hypothetical protein